MCQINQAIQVLLDLFHRNGIHEQLDLAYSWYDRISGINYTEDGVNDLFSRYNNRIMKAICDLDSLQKIISEIFDWGIPNVGEATRACLATRYSALLQKIHQESNEDNRVECVIGRLGKDTPLSSWTKVLAAYDPNRFWIYDARVALALRFLSKYAALSYNGWYMPTPGSAYIEELAKAINDGHLNTRRVKMRSSYQNYLELLQMQEPDRGSTTSNTNTASHFEKMLFMLGGAIRDCYRNGNHATRDAIVSLDH